MNIDNPRVFGAAVEAIIAIGNREACREMLCTVSIFYPPKYIDKVR